MYKFKAWLWSIKKDREGEVTLTLKIPQTEAGDMWALPEETNFDVTMNPEGKREEQEKE